MQEKIREAHDELAAAIRQNTEKTELLTLLTKEKAEFARVLDHQKNQRPLMENVIETAETYKRDVQKLYDVVQRQKKEIGVCLIFLINFA